jgi:2-keto-3-deoxy-L-rhamnonate aldolase RhmA
MPMAMLEDVAAYEEVGRLCAVPGLDMFFLGAGDLAMSMELPGQASHPRVVDRLAAAAEVLRAHGSTFGAMAATPEAAKAMVSLGCRLLAVSAGGLLASAARTYLTESRASVSTVG